MNSSLHKHHVCDIEGVGIVFFLSIFQRNERTIDTETGGGGEEVKEPL